MEKIRRSFLYLRSPTVSHCLASSLRSLGWQVHVADHPRQAKQILDEQDLPVGLLHLETSEEGTLDQLAQQVLSDSATTNWVALLPRKPSASTAVLALVDNYCYDYHTSPADLDILNATLGHAYGMAQVSRRLRTDNPLPAAQTSAADLQIVGLSPAIRDVRKQIRKVANSDLNLMIRGESGTGKELVAQAVHRLSSRSSRPFVAVNCAALPKELIQTELFGHEKGAFTGADRRHIGRIEAAQGGTVFLDEIGDLPLDLQANLLRFLQEKTIQRVGGTEQIPIDVRVITATHVNLEKATAEGRFREDLYYRLNVLHIDVPPLRHRTGDIELLANHFFRICSNAIQPSPKGFSRRATEAMNSYPWPGNVRELLHRVQRAVVMSEAKLISPADLAMNQEGPNSSLMTLAEARLAAEKSAIECSLAASRNNVSKAARYLGISRVTLYRLMEQHGIDVQRVRESPLSAILHKPRTPQSESAELRQGLPSAAEDLWTEEWSAPEDHLQRSKRYK